MIQFCETKDYLGILHWCLKPVTTCGPKKKTLSSYKFLSMMLLVILSKYMQQKNTADIKKPFNGLNARYIVSQKMMYNSF